VCTPDEVSGSLKRRVRSSSQRSSGQGSSAHTGAQGGARVQAAGTSTGPHIAHESGD
jgi:hypothetical protein